MWVKHGTTTPRFFILVNGVSARFFASLRDLCQGDPLLHFLFILVLDTLTRMTEAAAHQNFLSKFMVGDVSRCSLKVPHILFVDDTLIFSKPDHDNLCYMRALLLCFETISDLRINLCKSEIVSVSLVSDISDLALILGCKISSLLLTYLGLPLRAPHKATSI